MSEKKHVFTFTAMRLSKFTRYWYHVTGRRGCRTSDCQVWVNPQLKNWKIPGLRRKNIECRGNVVFTAEKSNIETAWLSVGSFISDQKLSGFNLELSIISVETFIFVIFSGNSLGYTRKYSTTNSTWRLFCLLNICTLIFLLLLEGYKE